MIVFELDFVIARFYSDYQLHLTEWLGIMKGFANEKNHLSTEANSWHDSVTRWNPLPVLFMKATNT